MRVFDKGVVYASIELPQCMELQHKVQLNEQEEHNSKLLLLVVTLT